jgi:hypothetical protein
LGALVALAGACQKSGDALLYVRVTATPSLGGVDTVDVIVTKVADASPGSAAPLHYPCPDGGVTIGSTGETLTVTVPGSVGPVTVTAVARGAGGHELAHGTSSAVTPQAGSITNVTVTLGSSPPPDGGTSDGAGEGGAGGSTAGAGGGSGDTGNGGAGAGGIGGGAGSGSAGAGGTAGGAGSGGAGGTAGGAGSGGAGAGGSGGAGGTGGASGAGGTTCVPRRRDCTSHNDNDCNGKPDDAESAYCHCAVNTTFPCTTGLKGICSAGSQPCVVSVDKTTSDWGACVQINAKGTETCANPGTDDDCNDIIDDVPTTVCNVKGLAVGACANGGYTGCNGTTQVCNPMTAAIGDLNSTTWHTQTAPNGSWDWNCDGVATKQYPDTAPAPPTCMGVSMTDCPNQPNYGYALNPFACGDYGDVGNESCYWATYIPGCTNKTGTGMGYQQGCR